MLDPSELPRVNKSEALHGKNLPQETVPSKAKPAIKVALAVNHAIAGGVKKAGETLSTVIKPTPSQIEMMTEQIQAWANAIEQAQTSFKSLTPKIKEACQTLQKCKDPQIDPQKKQEIRDQTAQVSQVCSAEAAKITPETYTHHIDDIANIHATAMQSKTPEIASAAVQVQQQADITLAAATPPAPITPSPTGTSQSSDLQTAQSLYQEIQTLFSKPNLTNAEMATLKQDITTLESFSSSQNTVVDQLASQATSFMTKWNALSSAIFPQDSLQTFLKEWNDLMAVTDKQWGFYQKAFPYMQQIINYSDNLPLSKGDIANLQNAFANVINVLKTTPLFLPSQEQKPPSIEAMETLYSSSIEPNFSNSNIVGGYQDLEGTITGTNDFLSTYMNEESTNPSQLATTLLEQLQQMLTNQNPGTQANSTINLDFAALSQLANQNPNNAYIGQIASITSSLKNEWEPASSSIKNSSATQQFLAAEDKLLPELASSPYFNTLYQQLGQAAYILNNYTLTPGAINLIKQDLANALAYIDKQSPTGSTATTLSDLKTQITDFSNSLNQGSVQAPLNDIGTSLTAIQSFITEINSTSSQSPQDQITSLLQMLQKVMQGQQGSSTNNEIQLVLTKIEQIAGTQPSNPFFSQVATDAKDLLNTLTCTKSIINGLNSPSVLNLFGNNPSSLWSKFYAVIQTSDPSTASSLYSLLGQVAYILNNYQPLTPGSVNQINEDLSQASTLLKEIPSSSPIYQEAQAFLGNIENFQGEMASPQVTTTFGNIPAKIDAMQANIIAIGKGGIAQSFQFFLNAINDLNGSITNYTNIVNYVSTLISNINSIQSDYNSIVTNNGAVNQDDITAMQNMITQLAELKSDFQNINSQFGTQVFPQQQINDFITQIDNLTKTFTGGSTNTTNNIPTSFSSNVSAYLKVLGTTYEGSPNSFASQISPAVSTATANIINPIAKTLGQAIEAYVENPNETTAANYVIAYNNLKNVMPANSTSNVMGIGNLGKFFEPNNKNIGNPYLDKLQLFPLPSSSLPTLGNWVHGLEFIQQITSTSGAAEGKTYTAERQQVESAFSQLSAPLTSEETTVQATLSASLSNKQQILGAFRSFMTAIINMLSAIVRNQRSQ